MKLFSEKGVASVSVRDIANACGIGESALYRHMCSKEELAGRIFKRAYLDFAHQLRAAELQTPCPKGAIAAYVRVILSAYDENPDLVLFLLSGQQDILARTISRGDVTPLKVVRQTIMDGMGKGVFAGNDPDLVTAMVFGATLQPLTFVRYGRLPAPAKDLAPEIFENLMKMLCPIQGLPSQEGDTQ